MRKLERGEEVHKQTVSPPRASFVNSIRVLLYLPRSGLIKHTQTIAQHAKANDCTDENYDAADCSPPTKANQVRFSTGFLENLTIPPPLHSGATPFSPNLILIGSRDDVVKSRPNLSTYKGGDIQQQANIISRGAVTPLYSNPRLHRLAFMYAGIGCSRLWLTVLRPNRRPAKCFGTEQESSHRRVMWAYPLSDCLRESLGKGPHVCQSSLPAERPATPISLSSAGAVVVSPAAGRAGRCRQNVCRPAGRTEVGYLWRARRVIKTPGNRLAQARHTHTHTRTSSRLANRRGAGTGSSEIQLAALPRTQLRLPAPRLKTVHDKVGNFEINLRKKSLPVPACISTGAMRDACPMSKIRRASPSPLHKGVGVGVFSSVVTAAESGWAEVVPRVLTTSRKKKKGGGDVRWASAVFNSDVTRLKCIAPVVLRDSPPCNGERSGEPRPYTATPTSPPLERREVSPDRRVNEVMRHMAMLILHKAEEYTTYIQIDLKQGFQKCSFYREQPIKYNQYESKQTKDRQLHGTDTAYGQKKKYQEYGSGIDIKRRGERHAHMRRLAVTRKLRLRDQRLQGIYLTSSNASFVNPRNVSRQHHCATEYLECRGQKTARSSSANQQPGGLGALVPCGKASQGVAFGRTITPDPGHHNDVTETAAYTSDSSRSRGRGGVVVRKLPLPRRIWFDSRRGRSRISAGRNRAGRCRWSARFLGDLPFLTALSFQRCSITTSHYVAARPRSRSGGSIRATVTCTPSASSLLRARRALFPLQRLCKLKLQAGTHASSSKKQVQFYRRPMFRDTFCSKERRSSVRWRFRDLSATRFRPMIPLLMLPVSGQHHITKASCLSVCVAEAKSESMNEVIMELRRDDGAEQTGDPRGKPTGQPHRPARFPNVRQVARLLASHQDESGLIPKWESCRTMPLFRGFSRGSPISPAHTFRHCCIGRNTSLHPHWLYQDLGVKRHTNLFTHSRTSRHKRLFTSVMLGILWRHYEVPGENGYHYTNRQRRYHKAVHEPTYAARASTGCIKKRTVEKKKSDKRNVKFGGWSLPMTSHPANKAGIALLAVTAKLHLTYCPPRVAISNDANYKEMENEHPDAA
ncbi:hypothetical protein PR048_019199 [Dryococelus australis]|uniref:Uncharacterized protein n=1 Tax=Dryococelus australis TaxID=614101 RepID=A0ABQ9H337_9NEOP|nr:hypothetical protein PR048_019199 [Dryococelus australis]